jgi:DNA mismatch repair ATPase MutS
LNPDELQMDRQSFRDLEVFETQGAAPTLFDLINHTRTTGGAKVLRGRMRRPFSKIGRIQSVQASLRHIIEHRAAFDLLPSDSALNALQRYTHSGLPLITTDNALEFRLEALQIRFGDFKSYWQIMKGVERTAAWLRTLRRFVSRPELESAPGDLAPLIEEMRSLLDLPAFQALPAEGHAELWHWQIMRLDRMLRYDEGPAVDRLIKLIFEIDALVGMALATAALEFVLPEVRAGPTEIEATELVHPFLDEPVPNQLHVDQQHRLLFLTGPNMAGKTTYLRAAGSALYLAHLGMGVPARTFHFTPCDCLFTAITLVDNVRAGISFFRAEALRMKTIASAIANGRRVVALLDEPFMGTNVKDALDASRAVLTRLAGKHNSAFLVSSHLIELGEALLETGAVECARFEATDRNGRLEFDYVLRPGISAQRLGVRVLQEEGVFDLLARGG